MTSINGHGLRRQRIVQQLLAEVFHGRIKAGEHLVTRDLAERFGVSHTPIREALMTLAGIGIIDLLPNRGAIARRISSEDVREVCEVRRVLECAAVRAACGRIPNESLVELETEFRGLMAELSGPEPSFVNRARVLDSKLHDLIADSCGNRFLGQEIGRLKALFRSFRDLAWTVHVPDQVAFRLREEAREHLAIVSALQRGRADEAARAMSRHIRSGIKYWCRALPVRQPTEITPPQTDCADGSQSSQRTQGTVERGSAFMVPNYSSTTFSNVSPGQTRSTS